MKIAHLFTVPAGEKVTEKAFLRVLISSVCSMLLCMGCLFGTTWAWFTLEIDNPQNEIQIAKVEFKELTLTRGGKKITKNATTGAFDLTAGTYSLKMDVTNDAAAPKRPVYVVMTLRVDQTVKSFYFPLLSGEGTVEQEDLLELAGGKATLSFALSWVIPASAENVPDVTMKFGTAENSKQEKEPAKEQEETATKEEAATKEETPKATEETAPPVTTSKADDTTPPEASSKATEPPATTSKAVEPASAEGDPADADA